MGETEMQFVTPYNEPTLQLLNKLHGVTACKKLVKFNFDKVSLPRSAAIPIDSRRDFDLSGRKMERENRKRKESRKGQG